MRSLSGRTPLLALACLLVGCFCLASCDRDPIAPATPPGPPPAASGGHVLGLVEVTISGIGSSDMHASASAVGTSAPGTTARGLALDLTPVPGADGSIQLAPLSSGSFTEGERGNGGERYLYATFKVRNATSGGTAYSTPRTNLTFLAVSTTRTIEGTAISQMNKFDGSAADPAIAPQLLPTGAVTQNPATGERSSASPDVLQVLTEAEAASFTAPSSVTSVFPYGFVVRNSATPNSRTLPANPGPDQFDGTATFAFRVPLQASPANDPFTVSALFLAVDDGETRLTQSLEEQNPAGQDALAARVHALKASEVTLLPGGSYTGAAAIRRVCSVRTAGPASAPTATLVSSTGATFQSLSPNPYASDGLGSFIASPTQFAATFSGAVGTPTAENFVVNGSESGRHFLGESYGGGGTSTVTSPSGTFFPGEEVEVVLTGALQGCGEPTVTRLHVKAPTPSGGPSAFGQTGQGIIVGGIPGPVAAGDLNGDGALDVVTTYVDDTRRGFVSVLLNSGDGAFQPHADYAAGTGASHVAIGDLNGDGALDLVTSDSLNTVSVLLGRGDGTFPTHAEYTTAPFPGSIAIGDLNGDGRLDLVVEATVSQINEQQSAISVLLGNGDGTFRPHADYTIPWGPRGVHLADLDGDGILDVVAAHIEREHLIGTPGTGISVLLGNGDGTLQSDVEYSIRPNDVERAARDLAIGDLNGDGIPDLVVADNLDPQPDVSVLLGNGDGTFQSHVEYPVEGDTAIVTSVAIADLNGDGKLDLLVPAVASSGTTNITYRNNLNILYGGGDGTFPTSTQLTLGGDLPGDAIAADLNGDGKLDVAFPSSVNPVVVTRWNQ